MLVLVTQSNLRGQVVAASYYTVVFPDPSHPATGLATPHGSARSRRAAVALSGVNPGDLTDVAALQPLVRCRGGGRRHRRRRSAGRGDPPETAARIQEWPNAPTLEASRPTLLIQRSQLRQRARRIDDEQSLAHDMNPDRRWCGR